MAYLKSTTAYIYDKLNAPVGTKMVFNQTTSPLGWTKETGSNDVALRLISGTVGTGGTVAFDTCFASKTPTISMSNAAVTLDGTTVANHGHGWSIYDRNLSNVGFTGNTLLGGSGTYGNSSPGSVSPTTGGGNAHTHTNTASSNALDMDVSYVDVIIATKA